MLAILNIGTVSQRGLTWEEAVAEFNLSRTAMYGRDTTKLWNYFNIRERDRTLAVKTLQYVMK